MQRKSEEVTCSTVILSDRDNRGRRPHIAPRVGNDRPLEIINLLVSGKISARACHPRKNRSADSGDFSNGTHDESPCTNLRTPPLPLVTLARNVADARHARADLSHVYRDKSVN
jgi:hypothetical protein